MTQEGTGGTLDQSNLVPEGVSGRDRSALVHEVLAHARGDEKDISAALYVLIRDTPTDERAGVFRSAAEEWGILESSRTISAPAFFTSGQYEETKKAYADVVDEMLNALVQEGLDEDAFYARCVEGIVFNPFFRTDHARAFAVHWILADPQIPYFALEPGVFMSNDEFLSHQKRLIADVHRVRYIMSSSSITQATERSSLLLKHIAQVEPDRDRPWIDQVVLMAIAILFGEKASLAELRAATERMGRRR